MAALEFKEKAVQDLKEKLEFKEKAVQDLKEKDVKPILTQRNKRYSDLVSYSCSYLEVV
jgi:hypothetical protein